MRRAIALVSATVASLLALSGAAQAVVVDMGAAGQFGVALVPGTRASLAGAGIATVTSSAACTDPFLSSDLRGPAIPVGGLCWRGGPVLHQNETFALTWDPLRRYWATTRNYVETYLKNVANGSGTLTSPYAVATQYQDHGGRAGNVSKYGGGCIDYGSVAGFTCQFPSGDTAGPGVDYPQTNGCTVTGFNDAFVPGGGAETANDVCLTDAQLKAYLQSIIPQEGLANHTESGYSPVIALLTPPGVVTCLDAAGTLCSANSAFAPPVPTLSSSSTGGTITAGTYQVAVTYVTPGGETVASAPATVTTTGGSSTTTGGTNTITIQSPPQAKGATGWYVYVAQAGSTTFTRQLSPTPQPIGTDVTLTAPPTAVGPQPPANSAPAFCSYHSQVTVQGTSYTYVVQPWTALAGLVSCDEPDVPAIPAFPTDVQLAEGVGARLVSPLSQATIGSLTDPALNGWIGSDGSEINDNGGCHPLGHSLDAVSVGGTGYFLQREFNNAGLIESDPNAQICSPSVQLTPRFVVPSAVNAGNLVQFDGSATASSLIVPQAGYTWNFGDGQTATGPSVAHAFQHGGSYNVTLTVVDRGGNSATLTQPITIGGPSGPSVASGNLTASLRLLPQALGQVLRRGIHVMVTTNQSADGIASIMIPRKAASRADISGKGRSVVIGRGTVASLNAGTTAFTLHVSRSVASKLNHLRHVTITVQLTLMNASRQQVAIDAAGQY